MPTKKLPPAGGLKIYETYNVDDSAVFNILREHYAEFCGVESAEVTVSYSEWSDGYDVRVCVADL